MGRVTGYEDNLPAKNSGLREVTVSADGDKARVDTASLIVDSDGNTVINTVTDGGIIKQLVQDNNRSINRNRTGWRCDK